MPILPSAQKTWLVTGCAGFIGSNITQTLLEGGQKVIGIDNLITGHKSNLEDIQSQLNDEQNSSFEFRESDLVDFKTCQEGVKGVDYIIHQAALGSVPRSIELPLDSHRNNVETFTNLLCAMKENGNKRLVYASSSAVYGDHPTLPKVENETGNLLSPYALTKKTNEDTAEVFSRVYGIETIGLRYFNVFGRRQDPNGAYAAVIPKWIDALIKNEGIQINGDGETSRDFTHIENVVQMNLLCSLTENPKAINRVYNVALGERTTLNELYEALKKPLLSRFSHIAEHRSQHGEFRKGDIRHSLADISAAQELVGYNPQIRIEEGLKKTMDWYVQSLSEGNN